MSTGVSRLSLLQVIFPTQESNWDLLHCRRSLCQLSYQGSLVAVHYAISEVLLPISTHSALHIPTASVSVDGDSICTGQIPCFVPYFGSTPKSGRTLLQDTSRYWPLLTASLMWNVSLGHLWPGWVHKTGFCAPSSAPDSLISTCAWPASPLLESLLSPHCSEQRAKPRKRPRGQQDRLPSLCSPHVASCPWLMHRAYHLRASHQLPPLPGLLGPDIC